MGKALPGRGAIWPLVRYRLPVIGGILYRRDMRLLGRGLGEAFRRGMEQASVDVAREIAAMRERSNRPFDGMRAVLGDDDDAR